MSVSDAFLYRSFISSIIWHSFTCAGAVMEIVCHMDALMMNHMKCTSEGGLYTSQVVNNFMPELQLQLIG